MLHEFLTTNRLELIERCRFKVARRPVPAATPAELEHGVPLFLAQLIRTLVIEQAAEPLKTRLGRRRSGLHGRPEPGAREIGATASLHGRELLQHGFTIDQVVHDYGDLCQAVTELAAETNAPIAVDEFRTLNRCLDDAIAGAVTEFALREDLSIAAKSADALDQRLGAFALELRRHLETARLAIVAIKAGNVGLKGATGAVLDLSLVSLRNLVDRTLGRNDRAEPGRPGLPRAASQTPD